MLPVWNFNLGIFNNLRLSVHSAGCQSSVDATGKIMQYSAGKQSLVELCRDCDHKELWRDQFFAALVVKKEYDSLYLL